MFLKVVGFQNVLDILVKAKETVKSSLNALEYIDYETYLICKEYANFNSPFQDPALTNYLQSVKNNNSKRVYVIIAEIIGDDDAYLLKLIENLYEKIAHLSSEDVLAETKAQMHQIWDFREHVVMHLKNEGTILKYDLSIPVIYFEQICEDVRQQFEGFIKYCTGYGHIGDSNIHLQVIFSKERAVSLADKQKVDDYIYSRVAEMNGSISAEHGIGQLKRPYLALMKSPEVLRYLAQIKKSLDPNGILNPQKTLI